MGPKQMNEYRINVTDLADTDLEDIFDYVAGTLKEPTTALSLVERLYAAINKLASYPFRCPLAKDSFLAKQGFRTLFIDNYIVFYVVDEKEHKVIVHRVCYGKRQYRNLFEQ